MVVISTVIKLFKNPIYLRTNNKLPYCVERHIRKYGTWELHRISEKTAGIPHPVFDIEKAIQNLTPYIHSIRNRNIEFNHSLESLEGIYKRALELKRMKDMKIAEREENTKRIQELMKLKDTSQDILINELKQNGKKLRVDLKNIEDQFYEKNDQIVEQILDLPNQLDESTPIGNSYQVIKRIASQSKLFQINSDSIQIEKLPDVSPCGDFLLGKATQLELSLSSLAQSFLQKAGFTLTSNSDIVKRILLDGARSNVQDFLMIDEPDEDEQYASYLVGGATLPSYLSLYAQTILNKTTTFPIKYFTVGKCYSKKNELSFQSSLVHYFIACSSQEEMEKEFQNTVSLIEEFLVKKIGVDVTISLCPALQLELNETKRICFLIGNNIQIGSVSILGDYVSKRLFCAYANHENKTNFLYMISGTFFNISQFMLKFSNDATQN